MARSKAKNTKRVKKLRKRRFEEQEGLCFYCRGPMILFEKYPDGKPIIKNMCTLEHICVPVLGEKKKDSRSVAACSECNQRQAYIQEQLYIEEHRKRSQNGHRFGHGKGEVKCLR